MENHQNQFISIEIIVEIQKFFNITSMGIYFFECNYLFKMGVPGDEILYMISTLVNDSENIYIDLKINGPFSIEHPIFLLKANYLKFN
jgi:hypothetical protein